MEAANKTENVFVPGLTLRPAQWTDPGAVTDVIREVLIADNDAVSVAAQEELGNECKSEGFNLGIDAWVVTTSAGRVVGYEEYVQRHAHACYNADGCVHPGFRGKGIGTALLRAVAERARQEMQLAEPDLRVYMHAGTNAADMRVREMFEGEGYQVICYHWVMEMDLTETPALKPFPAGIELRPFDKDTHTRLVFKAIRHPFKITGDTCRQISVIGNFGGWNTRILTPPSGISPGMVTGSRVLHKQASITEVVG